jgi:dienelactone hydrolase
MKKRYLLIIILLVIISLIGVLFLTSNIDDFELENSTKEDITFIHNNQKLAGTLLQPKNKTPDAVVVLIHGDGPMDRYANNGYYPLFNLLLAQNIAIFSWDKAGIGQSEGNWLHQSMADRANEAIAAKNILSTYYQGQNIPIGYFGYSQAGWVIPIAASLAPTDFSVIIGGAINWKDQGQYYQALRYQAQGKTPAEITAQLAIEQQQNDALFAAGITNPATAQHRSDMTHDRYIFVQKNYSSDSRASLATMHGPVLVALGADDLNVDAKTDSCRFQRAFQANPNAMVALIPHGTHSLMKAPTFNYQLESDWPWYKQLYFVYEGSNAYLPGIYTQIANWIKHKENDLAQYKPACSTSVK